jgi:F0F1-type ATP synthase assembly protein I
MKLITPPKRVRPDDSVGLGIESGLFVVLFFGLGALLDAWLGTRPIFMIVFVALAGVAVFVRLKYAYEARMAELDAERLDARRAGAANRFADEGPRT